MKKWIIFALLLAPFAYSYADNNQMPLPADKAFSFSVPRVTPQGVNLVWQIAPGYHLYKEHLQFSLASPKVAQLGKVELPPGIPGEDPIQGKFQQYQNNLSVMVPIHAPNCTPIKLLVSYQGCQDSGICYPPVTKELSFNLASNAQAKLLISDNSTTLG